jgi:outer membrane protein TolC
VSNFSVDTTEPEMTPLPFRKPALLATLALISGLNGCAHFDPAAGMRQVQSSIAARSGQDVVWQRDADSRAKAAQQTANLLQQPIGVDAAARLALLNNASLQAAFAELGVAEAEALQSSLLRNPFLQVGVQTPRNAGRNALDFGVSWDVLGLFTLSLRQEAAEQAKNAARLQAAMRALELAADTRAAWYGYLTALETVDLRQDMNEANELIAEIARRLDAAGNQAGLARSNAETAALSSRFALDDARARTHEAHARLLGLLGLADAAVVKLPDSLPRLPETDPVAPSRDELEVQHLAIAKLKGELARMQKLAASASRTAWTDGLELGWDWSRETSGDWNDGPSLGIGLPIFDTGAAHRAAAGFDIERLHATLNAQRDSLLREGGLAENRMKQARARVESLRDTLLPLLSGAEDTALLEYNAMQRSAADLLALKQRELDAIGQLVENLGDYWQARTALEALRLGVSLNLPARGPVANAGKNAGSANRTDGGH